MIDERVLARVNLYGLFKALELLPELDTVSADLLEAHRLTIEFRARGVGRARLHLNNGKVALETQQPFRSPPPDVVLAFTSPGHFNGLINGTRQPIPLKGLRYLRFLQHTFARFTGRLEHFLRPEETVLRDGEFLAANTRMSAYVAFHALSEIGNHDSFARQSARHIPEGVIQIHVVGDMGLYVESRDGVLSTGVGVHERPRCVLWFQDLLALGETLSGSLNTYDGMALGRLGMQGFVPMIDYLNPVLNRVPAYLQ